MPTSRSALLFFIPAIYAMVICGCDSQDTYRDKVKKENDAFTQAKYEELQPAEGTFRGTMHLNDSDQDFDCVLEVKRIWEFVRISQTQDQSDTVEVPKLGGSMGFSILDNLELNDLASFSPLTTPMGGYQKVMFDFGDYNPSGNKLILPYNVPGFNQGSLGELTGTFVNGHYQGTWFSKPFGEVGTFDLEQVGSRDGKDVQH